MCKDKKYIESRLVATEEEELKERVKAELNQQDPEGEEEAKILEKATSSVIKIS